MYPGNYIHPTAIIHPSTIIGTGNVIGPYTVIGEGGEVRGVTEFKGRVVIGDNNRISELVTIQRPVNEAETIIGNNCMIMAHCHIGHDVCIGDRCEITAGSVIGGYVIIEDGARIKMHCVVRNRKRIGKGATVGMGSVVVSDVPAGVTVVGNPAKNIKAGPGTKQFGE